MDDLARIRNRCRELIARSFADPRVDAAWCASRLGISRRHLHRAFAGHVGVAESLARCRLDAVTRLLAAESTLTVTVAILRCGYISYETYRRQCHRYLGLTPGLIRSSAA